MSPEAIVEIDKAFADRMTVHVNIGQEVVITTGDKLRLCLIETRDCMTARGAWLSPFGILLALVTTLVAADFKNVVFPSDTWLAIYVLGSLLCLVWLVQTLVRAWRSRNRGSIDQIVASLKVDVNKPVNPA